MVLLCGLTQSTQIKATMTNPKAVLSPSLHIDLAREVRFLADAPSAPEP